MKIISRSEILKHNTKQDCWIIVRNQVYDITAWLSAHPGGSDILLARAGEDATSYFIVKHGNNPAVFKQLERMKIGELPISEQITANDFNEPFLMELIDRCYKDKLYKVAPIQRLRYFLLRFTSAVTFFALSIAALYGNFPWYWCVAAVMVQALIGTSLFGFIAHENTHRNYPKDLASRIMLRATWPIFWPFISQTPLRFEHNSHHIKIGDPEFDYEVAAFASIMRYSGHVQHTSVHNHQHKIAKFLYPFYANIITTIGGIYSGFWQKHNRKVGLEHSISVLVTLTYFVIIPSLINGHTFWYVLLYFIYQCILFYGIYVGAAINHFVPSAGIPIPPKQENKYGYYVCQNTTNFCSSSRFWFWYTGGFNVQIEHHLIPFVPVENLQKMIPIVKELCAKYGYPYKNYPDFLQLWNDHYSYLFNLSLPDELASPNSEAKNKSGYQAR